MALGHLGAVWPTNVVTVSDNAVNTECTGLNNPYDCCAGANPNVGNTCTGNGLESDDIWRGLLVCAFGSDLAPGGVADTGGCILDLPAGTFTSAEVTISDATNVEGRSGRSLSGTTPFPNGLWIRGKGRATKLRSSIPPALVTGSNFNSLGIFMLGNFDPPVVDFAISRIKFTDFECDGQSPLQPAPSISASGYGKTVTEIRDLNGYHTCIQSRQAQGQILPRVVVQNVYAHNFIGTPISLVQVSSALVTNNLIEDSGCIQDVNNTICDADAGGLGLGPNFECTGAGSPESCCTGAGTGHCTPLLCCTGAGAGHCEESLPSDYNSGWINDTAVVGEIKCGCSAGQPDCYGWNVEPNFNPFSGIVGNKQEAYGIGFSGNGKALIARNTVNRSSKYSITGFSNQNVWSASDLVRIHRNTILKGRVELGTHFTNVWVSENTLNEPGMGGEHYNEIAGVGSAGSGGRAWIIDNTINPSASHGIDLSHRLIIQGMKRSIRIEGNAISNITGNWLTHSGTDSGRAIRILANTSVAEGCLTGLGEGLSYPGQLEIVNNTVSATFDGRRALEIEDPAFGSDHACPGPFNQLMLTGGSYLNGSLDTSNLAKIFAVGINATGLTLNGAGALTWLSGSTAQGCTGFTTNGTTSVVDNSGNGIGSCP